MALNNLNNWTDGCIILLYINTNNLRFHTVFASHVSYIRGESEPLQRRNVNTKSYPSDCVNRGLRANKLIDNNLWLNGPMFLFNDESEWPGQLMYRRSMPNNDSKVKKIKPSSQCRYQLKMIKYSTTSTASTRHSTKENCCTDFANIKGFFS